MRAALYRTVRVAIAAFARLIHRAPAQQPGSLAGHISEAVPAFPRVVSDLIAEYASKTDRIQAYLFSHPAPDPTKMIAAWRMQVEAGELEGPDYRRLDPTGPELRTGLAVLALQAGSKAAWWTLVCSVETERHCIVMLESVERRPGWNARITYDWMPTTGDTGIHSASVGTTHLMHPTVSLYMHRTLSAELSMPVEGVEREELDERGAGTRIKWSSPSGDDLASGVVLEVHADHLRVKTAGPYQFPMRNHQERVAPPEPDSRFPHLRVCEGELYFADATVWIDPFHDAYPDSVLATKQGEAVVPMPGKAEMGLDDTKGAPSKPGIATPAKLQAKVFASFEDFSPMLGGTDLWVESRAVDLKSGSRESKKTPARYEGRPLVDGVFSKDTIVLSFDDEDSVPAELAGDNVAPQDMAAHTDGRARIWLKLNLSSSVSVTLRSSTSGVA